MGVPEFGVQSPRVEVYPLYASSLGKDAVDLAEYCGLSLFPWQQYVLERSLTRRADGKWAAPDVAVCVPRQNGKGALLEARTLAGLFLAREELIIHTAHEFKTASQGFARLRKLVTGRADLMAQVRTIKVGNNEPGVYLKEVAAPGGRRVAPMVQYLARSGGSGRGFSCDCLFMDEAYAVGMAQVDALEPTMGARPNPQTWWTSSAGFAYSEQLRALRKRALAGDSEQLAYFEWSVDEDDFDAGDPSGWAQANPSMGYLISPEFLSRRYRTSVQAENVAGFAREHLGVWEMNAANSVIGEEEWGACLDELVEIEGDRVAVGVDVSPDRRASVVVCGRGFEGRLVVDVVANDEVGEWVVDVVEKLVDRWDVLGVVVDSSGPVGGLLGDFATRGVEVRAVGSRVLAQASGGFLEKVKEGRLAHVGEPVLTQAALSSSKKRVGDAWAFSRHCEWADTSPLIAATLAVSQFEYLVGAEVAEISKRESEYSWIW